MMKFRYTLSVILLFFVIFLNFSFKTDYSSVGTGFSMPDPVIPVSEFKADTFNIVSYGARGDGFFKNTDAINQAISACSENGGGVVLIPEGNWLTGPIVLKSNVNLHLDSNALVQFSRDFSDYPLVESNFEGLKAVRNQAPVSGINLENIAITGKGILDGSGDAWRMVKKGKMTDSQWKNLIASGGVLDKSGKTWYPSEKSLKGSQTKEAGVLKPGSTLKDFEDIKDYLRPNMLSLTQCKNILLEGFTIQNSPAWCIHPLMSENLHVKGIHVRNPWYAQNGDGIDVESCKNVIIESSTFDVGDDAICMKSGRDEEGRKRGMPTENVLINNCVVFHGHGGFVIGSEMSGGVRNVKITNSTFIGTDVGLRFKTTRGRGGIVENIYASHINMKDIAGDAIRFDMYYAARDPVPMAGEKREEPRQVLLPVTDGTPRFRNFHISHVYATGADRAIFMRGLPEMKIQKIRIDSSVLVSDRGMIAIEAEEIHLKDVQLQSKDTNPVISLSNSNKILLEKVEAPKNEETYLTISGKSSGDIQIKDNPVINQSTKIQYLNGASGDALKN